MKLQNITTLNIIEGSQEFLDAHNTEYIEYVQPTPIPKTLEETKDIAKEDVITNSNTTNQSAYVSVPDINSSTFDLRSRESAKVVDDANIPLIDTPYISELNNQDINDRAVYATATMANIQSMADLEQWGTDTVIAIDACTTIAEVDAIDTTVPPATASAYINIFK